MFVGAAILPHGALPFDNPSSSFEACRKRFEKLDEKLKEPFYNLYKGSLEAGKYLSSLEPDLIILHSPHGVTVRDHVGVFMNATASGNAEWNDCWKEYQISVNLDNDKAEQLLSHFKSNGVSAIDILGYSGLGMVLRWGEVIPIWYLMQSMTKDCKFVILTQSRHSVQSIGTQFNIGNDMGSFIDTLDPALRVAVVISGDLSHTYATDCKDPLYAPDPRSKLAEMVNDSAAKEFEAAVKSWITCTEGGKWCPSKAQLHLEQCFAIQPKALSCGIQGMAVLHNILDRHSTAFSSKLYCCEAPTYYGMLAATFALSDTA